MNIWYIHLVMSNLNWIVTMSVHMLTLSYNVHIYISNKDQNESLFTTICAISIKLLACVVYLWLTYFTD